VGCVTDSSEENAASIFSLKVNLTLKIEAEFYFQTSPNSPSLHNEFIQEQTKRQYRSSIHTTLPLELPFVTNIKIPVKVVAAT
jgi:hypothetical protein